MTFVKPYKWKVNIEIKSFSFEPGNFELVEKVINLINQLGMEKMVMLSSFNHTYIKRVKELDSKIITAALADRPLSNCVDYLKEIGADAYNPSISVINLDEIELLCNKSFSVIVWTVNSEKVMKDLIKVGVDGIITDFPQRLKTILNLNFCQ